LYENVNIQAGAIEKVENGTRLKTRICAAEMAVRYAALCACRKVHREEGRIKRPKRRKTVRRTSKKPVIEIVERDKVKMEIAVNVDETAISIRLYVQLHIITAVLNDNADQPRLQQNLSCNVV